MNVFKEEKKKLIFLESLYAWRFLIVFFFTEKYKNCKSWKWFYVSETQEKLFSAGLDLFCLFSLLQLKIK